MATYYVRKSGSDANAGTSPGAAWLTIGKALGASGIASGDTVYIGAGVYRETVTIGMTSPTVETFVIADVDGAQTGDPGEVTLSAWTVSDFAPPSSGAFDLNGRDHLTFRKIKFVNGTGGNPGIVQSANNAPSTDITFEECSFVSTTTAIFLMSIVTAAGVAANWTVDRCRFLATSANATAGVITVTLARHTADYDANITIRNCLILGGANPGAVRVISSGAGTGFGGGVKVTSCTSLFACVGVVAVDANISTTFPIVVTNSLIWTGGTALSANTSGQITESFNMLIAATARTNVAIGTGSVVTSLVAPLMHFGHERAWDGQDHPFAMPTVDSPLLGFGATSAPTVDLLNRPRAGGVGRVVASGTATAGANTTLTDSGASWKTNAFNGAAVRITGGTGSGQSKLIKSHTGTVLTMYGNWQTNPDNTSTYVIYFGNPSERGSASAGAASTLTDSSASWGTNMWTGYTIEIVSGTGSGQTRLISSNTGTVITVSAVWGTNPDNTSKYKIYRQTSQTAIVPSVGALERHDTAEKETGTTDAGGVAMRLTGYADQRILVPVDATSTTISIRARYDSNHAATNKPQAVLLANGEIGVTTETLTMTAAADTWETLTFAAQTPTAKGWVTIELRARADDVIGEAFFDTLAVA